MTAASCAISRRPKRQRLRTALEARDTRRNAKREAANRWRRERGYAEWPAEKPDHLTPIVLLALNTGLRRGEIFNLRWTDVDLVGAQLTVRGEGAKSGQTRHVPLNAKPLTVAARRGRRLTSADGYVFPGRADSDDGRLDDVKKAWLPIVKAAKLTAFRFHDLRHTFASKLVMAGVDLNTVRELLGHSDLKMTLAICASGARAQSRGGREVGECLMGRDSRLARSLEFDNRGNRGRIVMAHGDCNQLLCERPARPGCYRDWVDAQERHRRDGPPRVGADAMPTLKRVFAAIENAEIDIWRVSCGRWACRGAGARRH